MRLYYRENPKPTETCCGSAACEKLEEPFEKRFFECSRCRLIAYCSKECQAAHWKEHKRHCRDIGGAQKEIGKTVRRVQRFLEIYRPLLCMAAAARLILHNVDETKGEYVIIFHISDLPNEAEKPRLCIDKMEPKRTCNLLECVKDQLRAGAFLPNGENQLAFLLVYNHPDPGIHRLMVPTVKPYREGLFFENNGRKDILAMLMGWIAQSMTPQRGNALIYTKS